MTYNDPDYKRQARSLLNEHMFEHAAVEALLGIAYEQRTANLLTLDHRLRLMQQDDMLGDEGEELLSKVSTQALERLGFSREPTPSRSGCE